MKVIGTGVGRTGTMSLRLAIQQLGFGPCHHMEVVGADMSTHVPLWNQVLDGAADWDSVYAGFENAVDWPTASFFRELYDRYPDAKFILSTRDPETWADSFGDTIYTSLAGADQAPAAMQDWLAMATRVIERAGFPLGMSRAELADAFVAHNERVRGAIPAGQLLEYQVREGWEPLCEFLGVPVPDTPYPRTNNREEFWQLVNSFGD
jgi:hypothetical protein